MISRLAWCTSRAARRALGLNSDHGFGGLALHTTVPKQHGDAQFDPNAPSWVSTNVRWIEFCVKSCGCVDICVLVDKLGLLCADWYWCVFRIRIEVTFVEKDGGDRKVKANLGQSLLEVAHENEIDLEGKWVMPI